MPLKRGIDDTVEQTEASLHTTSSELPSQKKVHLSEPTLDLPVYYPSLPSLVDPMPSIEQMVGAIPEQSLRSLLCALAKNEQTNYARSMLADTYTIHLQHLQALAAAERAKVINFDHYSKSAWKVLNVGFYAKLSGSKQYEAAGDVFGQIAGCIESIGSQVSLDSSFGTKLSALETLRKIAKTVLLSTNCLGHEVRKEFQYDACLTTPLRNIAVYMDEDEARTAGHNVSEQGKGTLLEKMKWVLGEWKSYCLGGTDDLLAVVDRLAGLAEGNEGDATGEGRENGREEAASTTPAAARVITID